MKIFLHTPESQKSPLKPYVYKETVRGKAKKKLKGWSCKECEQFYNGLNLTEAELEKKMNECSKHKNRFKPNEETMAGFWDLSIAPTQEDKNTPAISTPSQESNESTIYCFYKN
ncbi:hypothetical protein HHI36_006821 [Cryptolaemus montrouzieri]|uniref:DNA endonuclease activator Ctp1 C-terminal domain-containing protein n=1 Tax=Cryptolaemus montrouzieri TaxID=559131 RepID=A0ABD2MN45_9CUCU